MIFVFFRSCPELVHVRNDQDHHCQDLILVKLVNMVVERDSLLGEIGMHMRDFIVLCLMIINMGPLLLLMQHWVSQTQNVEFVEKDHREKILQRGMKV